MISECITLTLSKPFIYLPFFEMFLSNDLCNHSMCNVRHMAATTKLSLVVPNNYEYEYIYAHVHSAQL